MSGGPRLRIVPTEEIEPDLFADLTALCSAAFDEPFADQWERVGPGIHVIAAEPGRVVAHAMLIDRRIYLGHEPDLALDVGYVEHVATWPELQRHGFGTAVMREIGRLVDEEYALGALSTGSNGFYERLGWETWRGLTSVRTLEGERVRSPGDDGSVMVRRTPRTPPQLDLGAPIAIEWRPGQPW